MAARVAENKDPLQDASAINSEWFRQFYRRIVTLVPEPWGVGERRESRQNPRRRRPELKHGTEAVGRSDDKPSVAAAPAPPTVAVAVAVAVAIFATN